MAIRSALMNVMLIAVKKAAKGLVRDFGELENLQVSRKGPSDFVSNADLKAEKILKAELRKARPAYSFLMEESGAEDGADTSRRWIVDPLDGTTNFLHGIPHFAISVALEEKGEIVAGVIYNPILDELYTAEKGNGAFVNDRRLRVSGRRDLAESLFATGIPFQGKGGHARFLGQLAKVMAKTSGVRRIGAASLDLAYVAAGRVDGYWEEGLHPWDCAAGILLVKEAGGYVTTLDGKPDPLRQGSLLAANPLMHPLLGELLAEE
ncbi:inositol monophosphatase family protein [Rhodospirillum rubrum]|uniref:Inositol-1-monophosphatase n=1 Tax=Rhodospirillum rubrum (strain ATCC 11170 / ATH 1.1.1 / DSM 467 / LMG 4362 / NCIMB 8255 / S1) TaxID=269796 RepID=Q2RVG8_RHORT|nr:inositol monophosphatase family protein [Rhodospirillum rubrum]ABC21877.1 Inositol monophosphatase [Rhodospirillum rubrum ATCC 11170]AEO47579.1 inositol monophosphatase [Rhodospirillum rubrum F11]QXG81536.1 inositol monophosphatase [Rhodospirillum rubrum]